MLEVNRAYHALRCSHAGSSASCFERIRDAYADALVDHYNLSTPAWALVDLVLSDWPVPTPSEVQRILTSMESSK